MERKLRLKRQGQDTLLGFWERFHIIWIMGYQYNQGPLVHLTRVPLATFWKRIGPQNKLRRGGVEVAGWTGSEDTGSIPGISSPRVGPLMARG